jgi:hypothetical protein
MKSRRRGRCLTDSRIPLVAASLVFALVLAVTSTAFAYVDRFGGSGGSAPFAPYTVVPAEEYAPYTAGPAVREIELYAPYAAGPVIHASDVYAPYTEPARGGEAVRIGNYLIR